MRARFSAYRSREKQGNAEILQARQKFTPANKKRVKVLEDSSGGEETPKKNKKKQSKNASLDASQDLTSPSNEEIIKTSTNKLPVTPPIHNTRSSRSTLTVTKLTPSIDSTVSSQNQTEKNESAIVDLTEYQAQPTIRISDSILKIINDENENKKLISDDDISE